MDVTRDPRFREHRGARPSVHADAYVASTALLSGDVTVDAGAAILDGAILTAESAPVRIGAESIVMENAVVRGAGRNPAVIGNRTLVGPHAHVTGARIGDTCLVATHAAVFNSAVLGDGVLVAIGAIVHVGTRLTDGARVPMQHIAVGDPARVFAPHESPEAHAEVDRIGFTKAVFDHDTGGMSFSDTIAWLCSTYASALRRGGER